MGKINNNIKNNHNINIEAQRFILKIYAFITIINYVYKNNLNHVKRVYHV